MRVTAKFLIRIHILRLAEGMAFTTRNVLAYGNRPAVDQVLSRFVKDGFIRRLARGIFVRDSSNRVSFTIWDIANLKSGSFQRKLAKHAKTTFQEIFEKDYCKPQSIFAINGSTSKFKMGETIVHLKETCQRKAALSETVIGQRMRALWEAGRNNVTDAMVSQALVFQRGGAARTWLRANFGLLPAWLADRYHRIDPTFRFLKGS
jgi:hypothetical protein